MNPILKYTIIWSIFNLNFSVSESSLGKSSVAGLVGSQNDAHFGKHFFLLVDTFQHLVYGHENEVYEFTYWFGNVSCSDGFSENCDIRACGGVKDAATFCDETEDPAICKCKFPSTYPQNCGQPKLVLETKTYYYGKDGTPESETFVTTINFVATCTILEGEKVPLTPEPVITITQGDLANENAGLKVTVSITQYVQVPGLPVYFWTVQTILIQINKTSLAMVLEKITGIEHLIQMMKEVKLNESYMQKVKEFS